MGLAFEVSTIAWVVVVTIADAMPAPLDASVASPVAAAVVVVVAVASKVPVAPSVAEPEMAVLAVLKMTSTATAASWESSLLVESVDGFTVPLTVDAVDRVALPPAVTVEVSATVTSASDRMSALSVYFSVEFTVTADVAEIVTFPVPLTADAPFRFTLADDLGTSTSNESGVAEDVAVSAMTPPVIEPESRVIDESLQWVPRVKLTAQDSPPDPTPPVTESDAVNVTLPVVVIVPLRMISSAVTTSAAPTRAIAPLIVILSRPPPPLMVNEPVGTLKKVVASNVVPVIWRPPPEGDSAASKSGSAVMSKITSVAVPPAVIGSSPA